MCNAWNHPPSCSCGWGGEGHAGKRSPLSRYDAWVPPLQPAYESFTRPNSSCPVCGDPVFFYQSPTGGRVFFDELGPPWPKHPCTDSSCIPKPLRGVDQSSGSREIGWEQDGWQPILLRFETEIDQFFSRVVGVWCHQEVELYLRKTALGRFGAKVRLNPKSLAHLRELKNSTYELSLLNDAGNPAPARCYPSLALAREFEPSISKRSLKAKKKRR